MPQPSIQMTFPGGPSSTIVDVAVNVDRFRTFGVVGDVATWQLTKAYFTLYEDETGNIFHGEVDLPGGSGATWSYTWNGRLYKEGGGQQIQVSVKFDTVSTGVKIRFNMYW